MEIKYYPVLSLLSALACIAIYFLWQGLELFLYGEIQPRKVDNIIGLILMTSVSLNIRHWYFKRINKKYEKEITILERD